MVMRDVYPMRAMEKPKGKLANAAPGEEYEEYREAIADGYYALKLPAAVHKESVKEMVNFFRERLRQLRTQAEPTEEVVKKPQKK